MAEESKSNQKTFKCADMGHKDCSWEVSGRSEDELMPQIDLARTARATIAQIEKRAHR